jgi:hypothetical protein
MCDTVSWIQTDRDDVVTSCHEHCNEPSGFMKGGKFN